MNTIDKGNITKAWNEEWENESLTTKPIVIDRKEEDRKVKEFQETGDKKILEEVYKNRISTLQCWAMKHYYPGLTPSVNDLFEDLSVVFVIAAEKFDKSKGSFNTCLFTYLLNRLKNMKSQKHAKKRTSIGYDGPAIGMEISMDQNYGGKDGEEISLKDVIPASENASVATNMHIEETLDVVSGDNAELRKFLTLIGEGRTLVSIMKEYNTRRGTLKITPSEADKFKKYNCYRMVKDLIQKKSKRINEDFKLINYKICNKDKLKYEIELKQTEKAKKLMKMLREIRRNKDEYKEELGVV